MIISEITDRSAWQALFDNVGSPSFLQSWEWGEVQKSQRYEVLRLVIYDKEELIAISQVIKIKSKRGSFLFVPHGPIIEIRNSKFEIRNCIEEIKNYLVEIGKKENYSFIRIAPTLNDVEENRKIFSDLGFKTGPTYMSAESVWILPLATLTAAVRVGSNNSKIAAVSLTDDELLTDMRKTTRYLIRKSERDGVIIEKRTDDKAVDDFYKIYEETVKREKFVPFSKKFIRDEFEQFYKTGNAVFLFGSLGKTPAVLPNQSPTLTAGVKLAAALILFTKSTAFYHQGASIHSKIPVPCLLQWEAIKEAKRRGCKFYNFWGVYRSGRTPKNWQGLSLFKMGFGGQQIDYVLPQDYIISKKYHLTNIYEKFLNWRRGV